MKNYGCMQRGLGCLELNSLKLWYKNHLGFHLDLVDDENEATFMTRYTGGEVFQRRALMSFQKSQGTGVEFWQFLNRKPTEKQSHTEMDELGVLAAIYETKNPKEKVKELLKEGGTKYALEYKLSWSKYACRDPHGNLIVFTENEGPDRLSGAVIGTKDIGAWIDLLSALGYELIHHQGKEAVFEFSSEISPFQIQYGSSILVLLEMDDTADHVYDDRFWGDPGYIHICFHVENMEAVELEMKALDLPFTVDSKTAFTMSESKGRFAYIEPEKNTWVEFIQVFKE